MYLIIKYNLSSRSKVMKSRGTISRHSVNELLKIDRKLKSSSTLAYV